MKMRDSTNPRSIDYLKSKQALAEAQRTAEQRNIASRLKSSTRTSRLQLPPQNYGEQTGRYQNWQIGKQDLGLSSYCPACSQRYSMNWHVPKIMSCCHATICQPCLADCGQQAAVLQCLSCFQLHLNAPVFKTNFAILEVLERLDRASKLSKGRSLRAGKPKEKYSFGSAEGSQAEHLSSKSTQVTI